MDEDEVLAGVAVAGGDVTEAAGFLRESERAYVGWRPARDGEPVNAWRSESPGNLHVHFRLKEFAELTPDERRVLARQPMTEDEYAAAILGFTKQVWDDLEEAAANAPPPWTLRDLAEDYRTINWPIVNWRFRPAPPSSAPPGSPPAPPATS